MMAGMPTAARLHKTVGVRVGRVLVGGGAPVAVQSMTMTDTADAAATARQCIELAEAGSELVRVTVNVPEAAAAVPEIKQRMLDAGCTAPLIGDFHYNGHLLLTRYPDCAAALDKYRINPGNVGTGRRRDEQFATICKVAIDHNKPVRIGVNGGSLNQELVVSKMQENTDRSLGRTSEEILNECMVISALQSTELALETGMRKDQIIISCKVSRPRDLIAIYRDLARQDRSAAAPRADRGRHGHERARLVGVGDGRAAQRRHRRHDPRLADAAAGRRSPRRGLRGVRAAAGARHPRVLAERDRVSRAAAARRAPRSRSWRSGRRTTSASRMPEWKVRYEGVETLTLAVMGCVVNGPGESKAANIGISLPGTGEAPNCPVFIDGEHFTTLRGTYDELDEGFRAPRRQLRRHALSPSFGSFVTFGSFARLCHLPRRRFRFDKLGGFRLFARALASES